MPDKVWQGWVQKILKEEHLYEKPEEGSEPGALRGYDALCHSALGIVDGYEDDSFQPEKNIERGEAAKMIAVMLNGGKDAVQDTSVSSFNDVLGSADAWANKYIEYGVSKGILAGVGGDRFAPASNVTGTQLLPGL